MTRLRLSARARAFGIALVLAIGGAGVLPAVPASAIGSGTTWHVQAGNLDDPTFASLSQDVTAFYNARTVVHPGDHVLFTPMGGHTVTFNPIRIPGVPTFAYGDPGFPNGPTGNTLHFANRPGGALLNSGAFATPGGGGPGGGGPQPPSTFTLDIGVDAAGPGAESHARSESGDDESRGKTYQFFCMFHRDMTGFITVLPAGARLPFTEAQNQVRAQKAMQTDLKRGKRALARASNNVEDNRVAAGLGIASVQGAGADSILRFAPATIEINVGQSVTWINRDLNTPHTVTFGPEIPDTSGVGPGFLPYGGTTVSAAGDQVNSGFLISQELIDYINAGSLFPPGFTVRRQVTFTFPKAGTYPYFCALHDTLGMVGTVIVRSEDNDGRGDRARG